MHSPYMVAFITSYIIGCMMFACGYMVNTLYENEVLYRRKDKDALLMDLDNLSAYEIPFWFFFTSMSIILSIFSTTLHWTHLVTNLIIISRMYHTGAHARDLGKKIPNTDKRVVTRTVLGNAGVSVLMIVLEFLVVHFYG